MPDASWLVAAGIGFATSLLVALATWAASIALRDVSIVDAAWSLLIVLPAAAIAITNDPAGARAALVLLVAAAWALRLSAYIVWRHRGQAEDARYAAIRQRHDPGFWWKSLYLVFGLQWVLACIVALPLLAAVASPLPWRMLDAAGLTLALFGLVYETVADAQLARFKADPAHGGAVMDRGLWRYSRHPNYFGECCVWWGLWIVAAAAGAWWTVVSPLVVTFLLLKVSGVTLLESTIGERRPAYAAYVRQTNAFLPGKPRA